MRTSAIFVKVTILSLAIPAIFLFTPPSANAAQTLTLIAEESFDYTGNLVGKNGGTGFTNAWDGYGSYNYGLETPGLTYSGLTTTGGNIYGCTATPNQYCAVTRQVETQTSGVIFFQFLANFGAQNGSGTPNIRFKDGAGALLAGVGSNGGSQGAKVSIMDNNLAAKVDGTSSAGVLNALNFIILRFDYTNNKTSMWLNPNLATYSYLAPPTANAEFENLAPQFRAIEIISRTTARATFDEIKIFKVTGTSDSEEVAANEAARKKLEAERAATVKVAREKLSAALAANQPFTTNDLIAADLPINSTASMLAAYKELTAIKDSLKSPLSSAQSYEFKYKKIMKYAMIERMAGLSSGSVYGRDLVKFEVIDQATPMKQLATYRLMKQPQSARDSLDEIIAYFKNSSNFFLERKERLVTIINKYR